MPSYIPARGDLVWLTFDPQAGHEQAGKRPAFVLSPKLYNQKVGLFLVCPITSRQKGYPFEVELPKNCGISGVILSDQIKSLDWRARKAAFIGKAPSVVIDEITAKIRPLIEAE